MFGGFTLKTESDTVKIYEYVIDCLYTVDCLCYQLWYYTNGTYMFVKFDKGKPVKTFAGLDIEKFEVSKHL